MHISHTPSALIPPVYTSCPRSLDLLQDITLVTQFTAQREGAEKVKYTKMKYHFRRLATWIIKNVVHSMAADVTLEALYTTKSLHFGKNALQC